MSGIMPVRADITFSGSLKVISLSSSVFSLKGAYRWVCAKKREAILRVNVVFKGKGLIISISLDARERGFSPPGVKLMR